MLGALGILLFSLIFLLGITYASTINIMGREVAKRQTLHLALVLFSFAVPLGILFYFALKYYLTALQNTLIAFQIISSIVFAFISLNLHFRKRKSGILLLNIGKDELRSSLLVAGIIGLGGTVLNTFLFFRHISTGFPHSSNLISEASGLFFCLSSSIFCILEALGNTEFRKNGIWFSVRLLKWQRIKSYKWEPSKPNVLTIRYQPSFPLFPGWMSFPIPLNLREDVDRILSERLTNENL